MAAALLLGLPATSSAAGQGDDGASRPALTSAVLLERGTGYGIHGGSRAVRELQRLLRRLGQAPGPVDGLYGPLTAEAVERFQRAHALIAAGSGERGEALRARLESTHAEIERVGFWSALFPIDPAPGHVET